MAKKENEVQDGSVLFQAEALFDSSKHVECPDDLFDETLDLDIHALSDEEMDHLIGWVHNSDTSSSEQDFEDDVEFAERAMRDAICDSRS